MSHIKQLETKIIVNMFISAVEMNELNTVTLESMGNESVWTQPPVVIRGPAVFGT